MDPNKICPVCGYDQLDEGPFTPEGCPTYEICPCCGFEYGFDDESEGLTYSQFRQRWIPGATTGLIRRRHQRAGARP